MKSEAMYDINPMISANTAVSAIAIAEPIYLYLHAAALYGTLVQFASTCRRARELGATYECYMLGVPLGRGLIINFGVTRTASAISAVVHSISVEKYSKEAPTHAPRPKPIALAAILPDPSTVGRGREVVPSIAVAVSIDRETGEISGKLRDVQLIMCAKSGTVELVSPIAYEHGRNGDYIYQWTPQITNTYMTCYRQPIAVGTITDVLTQLFNATPTIHGWSSFSYSMQANVYKHGEKYYFNYVELHGRAGRGLFI
jgi:hypothetical protein